MKKVLLAVLFCVFLIGCGQTSPSDTAKDYLKNVFEGNSNKAVAMIHVNDNTKKTALFKEGIEAKVQMIISSIKIKADENGGFKDIKILKETIIEDGTRANVRVKVIYKNGKEEEGTISLIKNEQDEWKILI